MNNIQSPYPSISTFNPYAYLAGLIDAEGCLRLNKKRNNNKIKYRPQIDVGASDKIYLDYLISVFPAVIYVNNDNKKINPLYKTMYTARYRSLATKNILEKIYPFLRIKKSQADILLKAFIIKNNFISGSHVSLDEEYQKLYKEISLLKTIKANNYNTLPEISPFSLDDELSYLAGLLDGDGSLTNRQTEIVRKDRNNKKYKIHIKRLAIMMNQPEGLLFLSKWADSPIYRAKQNTVFYIQISGQKLINILQQLSPYLILHRQTAIDIIH